MEIGALPKDTAIPKCAPMFMCVVFPEYVPECSFNACLMLS